MTALHHDQTHGHAAAYVSAQEYLQRENASETRHEWMDGEVFAMAGASPNHNDVVLSIGSVLREQLRAKRGGGGTGDGCVVRVSDQRVNIGARLYAYPDVVVACAPLQYTDQNPPALTDATVIIEVLSPSTHSRDRNRKFVLFLQLPSLRHYLLVSPDEISVEHRRKRDDGDWALDVLLSRDDVAALGAIDCALALRDVYDGLEFEDVEVKSADEVSDEVPSEP